MIFGAHVVAKKVQFSGIEDARWGSIVKMKLPGGGNLSLYQPKHAIALDKH